MLCVVVFVSVLVHLFSTEYMLLDFFILRFFMFLNFFTLCMLVLVTAGSFIQMFIGWEGVGLASFFLFDFWFSVKRPLLFLFKLILFIVFVILIFFLHFPFLVFFFVYIPERMGFVWERVD